MKQVDAGIDWVRYSILGKLTSDSLTEIYLARYSDPNGSKEIRVIKKLHDSLTENPRVLETIRNETRRSALLFHPNIARIYGFDSLESRPAIVMEYVDGRTLLEVRTALEQRSQRMPRSLALQIIRDVCAALDHAHNLTDPVNNQRQIIHHDISLENVMVTYSGGVKLVNFGMAKVNIADTFVGRIVQKRSCAAPELIQGKNIDQRLDIFSAGVVLYEILLGRMPWSAQNYSQLLRRILASPPLLPRSMEPDLPQDLEAILLRAIHQDRKSRYQTASDLQHDLEQHLNQGGTRPPHEPQALPTLAQLINALFPPDHDHLRRTVQELTTREDQPVRSHNPPIDLLEGTPTQIKAAPQIQNDQLDQNLDEGSPTQIRTSLAAKPDGPYVANPQMRPLASGKKPKPLPLLQGMNPGLSLEQTPIIHINDLDGWLKATRDHQGSSDPKGGATHLVVPEEGGAAHVCEGEPTHVREGEPTHMREGEPTHVRQIGPTHVHQKEPGPLLPIKTPAIPISTFSSHLKASRFKDTGKVQRISGQPANSTTLTENEDEPAAPSVAARDNGPLTLGTTNGPSAPLNESELIPITDEVELYQPKRPHSWPLILFTLGIILLALGGGLAYHWWRIAPRVKQSASPTQEFSSRSMIRRTPDSALPLPTAHQQSSPGATNLSGLALKMEIKGDPHHPADASDPIPSPRAIPEPALESTPARISIQAPTPGMVFLDGQRLAALPVVNKMIRPGQYNLRVSSRQQGYEISRRIKIKPGAQRTLRFSPGKGTIQVLVHPWAKVFLDGKEVGITPLNPLQVYQGPHILRLENSSLKKTHTQRVMIRPGKVQVVKVRLGK